MASQHAQMSCPTGGQFYACNGSGASRFIGCCGIDPCGKNGCPAGELTSTSFNTTYVPPDQQCDAGLFYTCIDVKPAFWGCCEKNACQSNGCPQNSLAGAFLSNNPVKDSPYINSSLPSSTSGTTSTVITISSPTSQPVPVSHPHNDTAVGVIIGATIGGFVLALLIFTGLFCLYRRESAQKSSGSSNHESKDINAALVPMYSKDQMYTLSPTSQYSTTPDGSPNGHAASPPMSTVTPAHSLVRHHVRNSTVSTLEVPLTQYTSVASAIQELDAVAAFTPIAELPAEESSFSHASDEAESVETQDLGGSSQQAPKKYVAYSLPHA